MDGVNVKILEHENCNKKIRGDGDSTEIYSLDEETGEEDCVSSLLAFISLMDGLNMTLVSCDQETRESETFGLHGH